MWMSIPSAAAWSARIGQRRRVERADRPGVRDEEDGAVGRGGCDLSRRAHNALGHRLVRLAVVPAGVPLLPARERLGEPRFRLGAREARPRPYVDFPELGHRPDLEAVPLRDDRGGVPRPREVARVDRGELDVGEPVGEGLRLLAAALVERPVRVSLPAALGVPVRLAVPGEEERRHAAPSADDVDRRGRARLEGDAKRRHGAEGCHARRAGRRGPPGGSDGSPTERR
jgi:hypothetical protein